jgi:penicillin-binding protein 1C
MGNLDRQSMDEVTGSIGPALVLRSVFAELNRYEESQPLRRSPRLIPAKICRISGKLASPNCSTMLEWFEPDKVPVQLCPLHKPSTQVTKAKYSSQETVDKQGSVNYSSQIETDEESVFEISQDIRSVTHDRESVHLHRPTPGLQLAMDPRIPDELEAFPFVLSEGIKTSKVEWFVDGRVIGVTSAGKNQFLWSLIRGSHKAQAKVWLEGQIDPIETEEVAFLVK